MTAVSFGLTSEEAARRLLQFGPNEVPARRRPSAWRRAAEHLREPMSMLLVVAAVVTGAFAHEPDQAIAIAAIVVLNATIGMVQEGRAAGALDALRAMGSPTATVRRDGVPRVVPAAELVPGDVILLRAGDRVPADVRLADGSWIEVDESVLTGESIPVVRRADDGQDEPVWSGTLVTGGDGSGEVLMTGGRTKFGQIAGALGDRRRPTPLQQELARLTAVLGAAAVLVAALVFALALARSEGELQEAFLVAVALAVAAVPEGLATVVVVALAVGVHRMAQQGAIVRRLAAVETLGCATAILTDKTGTLTENRLHVASVLLHGEGPVPVPSVPSEALACVAICAVAGNEATTEPPTGDAVDRALVEAFVGAVAGRRIVHVASSAFEVRRRSATSVDIVDDRTLLSVRGAPEVVLDRCDRVLRPDGRVTGLDDGARAVWRAQVADVAGAGMRTIALAMAVQRPDAVRAPTLAEVGGGLVLIAVVGLADPVRADARDAVVAARAAGIDVAMVTGDHPATALRIAVEAGVAEEADAAVTGADLDRQGTPVDPMVATVYARVEPGHKLALVRSAQEAGHVVAVTGDGVNDAPALRQADIGVAMGATGSDVAREAADVVITDDRLATIVVAVREGRTIYANVRNAVDYLVGGNLSEVAVVLGVLVLFPGLAVPLLPLQLLWLNLLTDGAPAIALALDPVAPDAMQDGPRRRTAPMLSGRRFVELGGRAAVLAASVVTVLAISRYAWDEPWSHARALMFSTLVGAHLLYAVTVHLISRPGRRLDLRRDRRLLVTILLELVLQVAVVMVPPARSLLDTAALAPREVALAVIGSIVPNLVILAGRRR